jgi:hypothetical protein
MDLEKEIASYMENTGRSRENIIGWNRDYVGYLLELYRETRDLNLFFDEALDPFNDIFIGCDNEMPVLRVYGHLIYRLSDYMPKPDREKVPNYPDDEGKIIIDGNKWSSLEDWREWWSKTFQPIPNLSEIIGTKYLVDDVKSLPYSAVPTSSQASESKS